jgi:hypothetical protein
MVTHWGIIKKYTKFLSMKDESYANEFGKSIILTKKKKKKKKKNTVIFASCIDGTE